MTFYLVFGEFDFTISAVSRFVANRLMLFQVFQRVLVSAESARSSPTISAVLRCVRSHDSLFAYRAVIVGVVLGWRLSLRRLICWRLEWFHSYIDHIAWWIVLYFWIIRIHKLVRRQSIDVFGLRLVRRINHGQVIFGLWILNLSLGSGLRFRLDMFTAIHVPN